MRPPRHPTAIALLAAPAVVYAAATRLRNRFYDRPGAARRAPIPVVSVGNLAAGGTGKTTLVAWLVRKLQLEALVPAVVTRGYRGEARRGPVLVSDGSGAAPAASRCGDEPCLLARKLPGAVIVAGSDRCAGSLAAAAWGAQVVVLDDGFQHRRLARDLDLVLLACRSPFGNGRVLPAGTLREPPAGLRRAHAIVVTRVRDGESVASIERAVHGHGASAPVLRSAQRRAGFVCADGTHALRPSRAIAFCGIGNPRAFRDDLEEEGVEVVAFREFDDHHPYTLAEWREMTGLSARLGAALVTTEKDLVRLPVGAGCDMPVVALRIEAEVVDEAQLMEMVHRAIGRGPA